MKPGRNDPCPCGSGSKYKRCCGLDGVAATPVKTPDPGEIGALVALVNHDRLSEAERRIRSHLRMNPNAGMLWKILGVTLMRQGKDALQALRKATDLLPNDGEVHGNLGAALRDRRQWTEALVSLRRALALRPDNVEALVDAADSLRELGQSSEAIPLYRRALDLSPRLLEARNNLGNALLELRRYEEAIDCYRLALGLKPDAQILCNLANAQRELGLLDEAIASSRQALMLDPRSSAAHLGLGLALAGHGRREEAAASYRRALEFDPTSREALSSLGSVLQELGAARDALSVCARAVELDPNRAAGHYHLGNALFALRRVDEAAASYARCLALDPRHAPAHLALGVALRTQHRHDEAEASCRAALAIDPRYVEALSLLGELRADRGRFSEAEALFRRTIEIDPDFSYAFASIATHRRMTAEDTGWLAGAEALLSKGLPPGHAISLRYALGKYFDDVGRYDDAFEHYRCANELAKRQGSSYDGSRLSGRVDEIIRSFDAPFLRRCGDQGSTTELPVFIIGMPRSGTSLTEQILASHPAVFGAGEVTFWDAAFLAHRAAQVESEAGGSSTGVSPIPGMARDYLGRLTALSGAARRVVDKMPANFLYAGLIHAVLPRAKIIHMRRHPVDTCLSIYFQNFFNRDPYANDLDHLAHYYGEYVRVTDHWRALLPATTLLEVPYEQLTADQEGWTRRMLEFIGLPWDPRCLQFHETDRIVITASKWQVRQKIHSGSAGRWRNYEEHLGPLRGLL